MESIAVDRVEQSPSVWLDDVVDLLFNGIAVGTWNLRTHRVVTWTMDDLGHTRSLHRHRFSDWSDVERFILSIHRDR